MFARALPFLLFGTIACATSQPNPPVGGPDSGVTTITDPDAGVAAPSDAGPADSGVAEDTGPPPDAGHCPRESASVVHFTTDDGVELEAELSTAGAPSRPLVVLFHMIPPSNDRRNYPASFVDALHSTAPAERQLNVLNVDRRGAGGSGGVARDAYTGPKGALDVKAAVEFFRGHACGEGLSTLGLVGASNGTTSVLDYTVMAAADPALLAPRAIVFLTGGTYTEAQNRMLDSRAVLDTVDLRFVFSTAERAWSVPYQTNAPAAWAFLEYANGDHGTRMFTAVPESVGAVANTLLDALQP